ncbi:hypothetical protein ACF3OB_02705 [Capnocytophaga canis]|uniref:hypothetical protein n=1 Tax=Capnocytophaga canis TaxID=1848903 RepID=UPI001562060B|nr:hypothetical protein [Capnocytophaga canis]
MNNIKEAFKELPDRGNEVLETNVSYYKLFVFRFIAKTSYGLLSILVLGMISLLVLFSLSFAFAYAIGAWIDNIALGFVVMALFYCLVMCIAYLFRKKMIERPLLRTLSEVYFKAGEEDEEK